MKKIYTATVVYNVEYTKKNFFGEDIVYEGEIVVPIDQYLLAFSKKNASDMVVYSNMWDEEIARKIMWRTKRVKDFDVVKKYVMLVEIETDDLDDLSKNMRPKDFAEWQYQKEING